MKIKWIAGLVCLFFGFVRGDLLHAQQLQYGVSLDTAYMLIGDQQNLTFQVRSDAPVQVVFPELKDTVTAGVEIVSGPERDSLKEKDGKWLYRQRYVITVFDTGVYVIPELPILLKEENYDHVLRTDSITFIVNTFRIDESRGNHDIVMPYAAPWTFSEAFPYLLWGIGGLALAALAVWGVIRFRKKKPLFRREEALIPPYELAIRSLEKLQAEKLWQAGRVKEYYTRLTDAIRQYLDGELAVPAMEQTSWEILHALERLPEVDESDKTRLAELLQAADFVKFAKATPLPDENVRSLETAYAFVRNTNSRMEEARQAERETADDKL
ncbi:MAG: hypothetical protein LBR65_07430 [Culturomica sp.]|jgi:uncharacterized protein YggL (DUF469 family)|nr:hypothetical protein [Culturomica sp.]